jgi:hypothetical protein
MEVGWRGGSGCGWNRAVRTGARAAAPRAVLGAEPGRSCPSSVSRVGANRPREALVRRVAAQESIRARFRRPRPGDRRLIAAPWTPLASLCLHQWCYDI